MSITETSIDQVWYTRCPVPTASGLAYSRGWLTDAYDQRGVGIGILQDAPLEIAQHHYDHQLVGLIREGGNVPAFAARADGARTKLIGLTWIDETQTIVVRPDSPIHTPADLRGRRIGVQEWADTRDTSMGRAMGLHGFKHALALGGLTLDDVNIVEVPLPSVAPPTTANRDTLTAQWPDLVWLANGLIDAAYVKGAVGAEQVAKLGLRVLVDLDAVPDKRFRVNNGTPRPLTAHEDLLEQAPELAIDFLVQTLRAADWASTHLDEVAAVLAYETGSTADGVTRAYRNGFHLSLHPDLSDERVGLCRIQKDFLLRYGFLRRDFDFDAWIDRHPLEAALAIVEAERSTAS